MADRKASNTSLPSGASAANRWVQRLSKKDMPVLGDTVQRLCTVSDDSSAGDLAAVVLRDPSMTSELLRMANSAYFNASGHEINTISRAVILLGFETVRSIGLSLSIVDNLLRNARQKQKVLTLIRQAVYAAVQAKVVAQAAGDRAPEEIFIAALLYRLGEMAVWAFADEATTDALCDALAGPNPRGAEVAVLGCTTRQITAGLAREWNLGDLLLDALQPRADSNASARYACVLLGHELEAAVRRHGWESPQATEAAARILRHARLPPAKMSELVGAVRRELKQAGEAFGLTLELETGAGEPADRAATPRPPVLEPAPALQLKVLRELSSVMDKKPDVQAVLDMVMEGIYRGIGLDRALLSVLNPDRQFLKIKYALGDVDGQLAQDFIVGLAEPEGMILRWTLGQQKPVWTRDLPAAQARRLIPPEVARRLARDFFLGPLVVRGRDIGLIYADRAPSERALDQEAFESFQHFIDQANLCLERLAGRGR